jgi:hypothetical protein
MQLLERSPLRTRKALSWHVLLLLLLSSHPSRERTTTTASYRSSLCHCGGPNVAMALSAPTKHAEIYLWTPHPLTDAPTFDSTNNSYHYRRLKPTIIAMVKFISWLFSLLIWLVFPPCLKKDLKDKKVTTSVNVTMAPQLLALLNKRISFFSKESACVFAKAFSLPKELFLAGAHLGNDRRINAARCFADSNLPPKHFCFPFLSYQNPSWPLPKSNVV